MSRISPTIQKAQSLLSEGRSSEARALLESHLRRTPKDAQAAALLGFALASSGDADRALFFAKRAVDLSPSDPGVCVRAASVMGTLGRSSDGETLYRRALETDPDRLEAIEGLATLLAMKQSFGEVRALAEHALRLQPGDGPFTTLLAGARQAFGRGREALELIESALARNPDDVDLLYARAATMNAIAGLDPALIAAAHRRYGERTTELVGQPLAPASARATGPLRVGFLSGDLRAHSVAYFLDPLLKSLDRSRLVPIAFSTNAVRDAVSARLRESFSEWHDLMPLEDRAAAELIRSRDIDLLIDLSGLSAGERLGVMAMRPARLQATYLGYPNTTGLRAIDYRIVDAVTDPPGYEDRCTERLARLDGCFVCFGPIHQAAPDPKPRDTSGGVVFGSFNVLTKLNDAVISLWARVVENVPRSRLLLKAAVLSDEAARADVAARFQAAGLKADRLELVGWVKTDPMLMYDRVDIALDPFPYNGTTTTCEALWMGVPVISLEGNTHAGRVGASLLTHAGLPELIAGSHEEYVRVASGLAADSRRLAEYRSMLRPRVQSTIADGTAFARRFERLLEQIAHAGAR